MGRTLKPYKVDEIKDPKSKVVVDIFLDRNEKDFFGVVQNETVRAKTAEECGNQVRARLEEARKFEWRSLIEITFPSTRRYNRVEGAVGVEFDRYQIAQTPTGDWIQRPYYSPEEETDLQKPVKETGRWHGLSEKNQKRHDRQSGSDIRDYHPPREGEEGRTEIPYTEEAWRALNDLRAQLKVVQEKLEEFLSPSSAEDTLARFNLHVAIEVSKRLKKVRER